MASAPLGHLHFCCHRQLGLVFLDLDIVSKDTWQSVQGHNLQIYAGHKGEALNCGPPALVSPVLPSTLILSSKNFSNWAMSMILSSTGFVQSMVKVVAALLLGPLAEEAFFPDCTMTVVQSSPCDRIVPCCH